MGNENLKEEEESGLPKRERIERGAHTHGTSNREEVREGDLLLFGGQVNHKRFLIEE